MEGSWDKWLPTSGGRGNKKAGGGCEPLLEKEETKNWYPRDGRIRNFFSVAKKVDKQEREGMNARRGKNCFHKFWGQTRGLKEVVTWTLFDTVKEMVVKIEENISDEGRKGVLKKGNPQKPDAKTAPRKPFQKKTNQFTWGCYEEKKKKPPGSDKGGPKYGPKTTGEGSFFGGASKQESRNKKFRRKRQKEKDPQQKKGESGRSRIALTIQREDIRGKKPAVSTRTFSWKVERGLKGAVGPGGKKDDVLRNSIKKVGVRGRYRIPPERKGIAGEKEVLKEKSERQEAVGELHKTGSSLPCGKKTERENKNSSGSQWEEPLPTIRGGCSRKSFEG